MKVKQSLLYTLMILASYGCLSADSDRDAKSFSDGNFLKTESINKDILIPAFKGLDERAKVSVSWANEIMYADQLIASISLPSASELGAEASDEAQVNLTGIYMDYGVDSCAGDVNSIELYLNDKNITGQSSVNIPLSLNNRTLVKLIIKNKAKCRSMRVKFSYHSIALDTLERENLVDYIDNPDNEVRKLIIFVNPFSSEFSAYKEMLSNFKKIDSELQTQIINSSTKEGAELIRMMGASNSPVFHYNYFGAPKILEGNQSESTLRNFVGL